MPTTQRRTRARRQWSWDYYVRAYSDNILDCLDASGGDFNNHFGVEIEMLWNKKVFELTRRRLSLVKNPPVFLEGRFQKEHASDTVAEVQAAARKYDITTIQKWDGSLRNRGFEIVTEPLPVSGDSLRNLSEFFEELRHLGAQSGPECGIHTHISRNFFQSDLAIAFYCLLWESFYPKNFILSRNEKTLLEQITRRGERRLRQYANPHGMNPPIIYDPVIQGNLQTMFSENGNHHDLINCANTHTIEFRGFSGTTNTKRFRVAIASALLSAIFCREFARKVAAGEEEPPQDSRFNDKFLRWLQEIAQSPDEEFSVYAEEVLKTFESVMKKTPKRLCINPDTYSKYAVRNVLSWKEITRETIPAEFLSYCNTEIANEEFSDLIPSKVLFLVTAEQNGVKFFLPWVQAGYSKNGEVIYTRVQENPDSYHATFEGVFKGNSAPIFMRKALPKGKFSYFKAKIPLRHLSKLVEGIPGGVYSTKTKTFGALFRDLLKK